MFFVSHSNSVESTEYPLPVMNVSPFIHISWYFEGVMVWTVHSSFIGMSSKVVIFKGVCNINAAVLYNNVM